MFQWDSPKSTGIFFRVDQLGKLDALGVFPEDVPPNVRFKGAGNGKYIEENFLMNAMDLLKENSMEPGSEIWKNPQSSFSLFAAYNF